MKIYRSNKTKIYFVSIALLLVTLLLVLKFFQYYKTKDVYIEKMKGKSSLYGIQLVVKEKHFLKLKKKRDEALLVGVLEVSDEDYIPATIIFNDFEYEANIRLKGDWTDHLEGIKWSYRVKLKGDKTILGMRKFSLHPPSARNNVYEWLFHKVSKDEGLMGLRYHFVEGFLSVVNKKKHKVDNYELGFYGLEESFDKRTIENNKRKVGVILKFSEDNFWKNYKVRTELFQKTGIYFLGGIRALKYNETVISAFGLSKILNDSSLNNQFIQGKNLLHSFVDGKESLCNVFDVNKMVKHTLLTNLFGAYHGLYSINLRYYYNPTTSKLEPITYDGDTGKKIKKISYPIDINKREENCFNKSMISHSSRYTAGEYLTRVFEKYEIEIDSLESILAVEFGNGIKIKRKNFEYNAEKIKEGIALMGKDK